MHKENTLHPTRFHRFCGSGGLNVCIALIACPLAWYLLHRWWGLDWFFTILFGFIPALIIAQLFILPLVLVIIRAVAPAQFCEICPACGERALALGLRLSEPTPDPALHRVYQLANCSHCHRHFHRLDDGSYNEQPEHS